MCICTHKYIYTCMLNLYIYIYIYIYIYERERERESPSINPGYDMRLCLTQVSNVKNNHNTGFNYQP